MNIQQILTWIHANWYLTLVHIVAIDSIIAAGFQAVGNTKVVSFLNKIGLFIGAIITATGQVMAKGKAVPVILIFLLLSFGSTQARADLFNPAGPGTNGKYKTFLASVNGPSGNTLQDLATVLNYLGEREGYAYNGRLKHWDITTGATIVSFPAYNLAVAANVLTPTTPSGAFFDGWSAGAEWNIGNYLAAEVQNVPVLQYVTQAYVGLYAGEETNSKGNYQFAPLIGGDIKVSFGPQQGT